MNVGSPGDWKAGSPEWANSVASRLGWTVERADKYGVDEVVETLFLIENSQTKPWLVWPPGKPAGSCAEFLKLACGHTIAQMKALIGAYRPDLKIRFLDATMNPLGERGNPTGANQFQSQERLSDNVSSAPKERKRGTAAEYLLARLKRDAEHDERIAELYELTKQQELTPKAAARKAGYIHKTVSCVVDAGAARALAPLIKIFGKEKLLEELKK